MTNYTILSFDEISSTSDLLKEHFSSFSHFTIIKSKYQSQGRGQFDRIWESNKDENLLFSILLKDLEVSHLAYLKQWIIYGLQKVLKSYGVSSRFREPNDIYVNDQKICGILFETRTQHEMFTYVVIGIGLNVNQSDFEGLNATSIKNQIKKEVNQDQLFESLLNILLETYKLPS